MTSVIVAGARTPIGKLLGAFTSLTASDLGGHAIEAAISRAGVQSADLEAVYFGNVVQAGVGPNPARLAAAAGGVPLTVPATSINKLCLSGLTALGHADLAIRGGMLKTALAGGTESMTNAPHLTHVRSGVKYGPGALSDALDQDALICGLEHLVMGAGTEQHQASMGIGRQEQDDFAARSHQLASAAADGGIFDDEIVPIAVRSKRQEIDIRRDEGIRADTTSESLASLRPAFAPDGTITAGSASQLSDGAAALVVMDKAEAQRRGLSWIAEIVSYATVAGPTPSLLHQPARAIEKAAAVAGVSVSDLDLLEINEAFASVAIASMRELQVNPERVNVNGGAIALGHPVGMSGARLALTLALALRRRGGGLGVAALCGGGGQGDAIILRVTEDSK
ncbi:acetyl-CoA acetyltransferase [Microbacterium sp. CH12i]|uniref:acetyl-CoA C-acyltransferase n=1 Tax=Microbacterium sp. CH12i TaxID=1479651 RepID=UPI000461DEEF|nr:acetyl-CoA C-acyltransferase [Microbacterium sp. CH12i]KDA06723.1 acetyl-CoA acetyltransferase [Microbacterium sp. CH12i]